MVWQSCSYLGERVDSQAGIEDGIGDLIAKRPLELIARTYSPAGEKGGIPGAPYAILSGCPSPTDSEVKRKEPFPFVAVIVAGVEVLRFCVKVRVKVTGQTTKDCEREYLQAVVENVESRHGRSGAVFKKREWKRQGWW